MFKTCCGFFIPSHGLRRHRRLNHILQFQSVFRELSHPATMTKPLTGDLYEDTSLRLSGYSIKQIEMAIKSTSLRAVVNPARIGEANHSLRLLYCSYLAIRNDVVIKLTEEKRILNFVLALLCTPMFYY